VKLKPILVVAGLVLAVVAALAVKVEVEGLAAIGKADAAWDAGEKDKAQGLYLQAGRWYLPGNGLRERSAERLIALARERTSLKNWKGAVSAYDDARALFYSTSSLTLAAGPMLDSANTEMAHTLAMWKRAEGSETPAADLEARYLEELSHQEIPSPLWSMIMGLALLVWLISSGVLAWRWQSVSRRRWVLGAALGGFVLWLVALVMMGP